MHNSNLFTCPVCGFAGLTEPPYDDHGCASFDICPSCGTEFGYDDAKQSYEELRRRWLASGALWWSQTTKPPLGWGEDKGREDKREEKGEE
jgi:hypothetical protein